MIRELVFFQLTSNFDPLNYPEQEARRNILYNIKYIFLQLLLPFTASRICSVVVPNTICLQDMLYLRVF